MSQFLWIAGLVLLAVVSSLVASYVISRAVSLAHYRSKLEYLVKKRKLGVHDEAE